MILCSGVFDGLHAGHVAYLRAAYGLGQGREPVVVALANDQYVRQVKQRVPRWTVDQRAMVLFELRTVARIVYHGPKGAVTAIQHLRPRVFVKGKDWEGLLSPEIHEACEACGCQIVYVDSGVTGHSSDDALSAHE